MKRLYIALALLVVIAIGSVAISHYLISSVDGLIEKLDATMEFYYDGDRDEALHSLQSLFERWAEKKENFNIVIDHNGVENVDLSMAKLQQYMLSEDQAMTAATYAELRFYFDHLYVSEIVSLENFF